MIQILIESDKAGPQPEGGANGQLPEILKTYIFVRYSSRLQFYIIFLPSPPRKYQLVAAL